MTDRELLEMAAKAAGITGGQSKHGYWNMTDIDGKSVVCCSGWAKFNSDTGEPQNPTFADAIEELDWNPLIDDGDALRLAVRLGLLVDTIRRGYKEGNVCAVHSTGAFYEPKQPDPYAATRRAIVRAAAEIGRAMP